MVRKASPIRPSKATGVGWNEKRLKEGINAKVVGSRFEIFKDIDSTNQYAMDIAARGAEEGTVVLAEWQTQGRGRMGREWVSPPGVGIYVTVILRPGGSILDLPKYTLLAGVAVAEAVREVAGLEATIKWPNDVLVNDKKVCGILEESLIVGSKVKYMVIGIGINVNTEPSDLPIDPRRTATSLMAEKGSPVDRHELLLSVLQRLDSGYADICEGRGETILSRWRRLSATLGRRVKIELADGVLEGQALDLCDDGGLLIALNGKTQKVMAGDIISLGQ